MKQQIILEHREALDKFEVAASKYRSCQTKNKCESDFCLCEAFQNFQAANGTLEEKKHALQVYNEQVITQNELREAQLREVNEAKRRKREERIERNRRTEEQRKQRILQEKLINQQSKKEVLNTVAKGRTIKGLTVELYKKHSLVEKLSDTVIRDKYSIPASSFAAWKKENNLVRSFTSEKTREESKEHRESKVVTASKVAEIEQQLEEMKVDCTAMTQANKTLIDKNKELKQVVADLQKQLDKPVDSGAEEKYLALEQKYIASQKKKDELTEKLNDTLFQLNMSEEMNETRHSVIVDLEKQLNALKESTLTSDVPATGIDFEKRYEATSDSAAHFEHAYSELKAEYEAYQLKVEKQWVSQLRQWEKYESMLNGRIELLKQQKDEVLEA